MAVRRIPLVKTGITIKEFSDSIKKDLMVIQQEGTSEWVVWLDDCDFLNNNNTLDSSGHMPIKAVGDNEPNAIRLFIRAIQGQHIRILKYATGKEPIYMSIPVPSLTEDLSDIVDFPQIDSLK